MTDAEAPAEGQLWLEKFYIKDLKFVSPDSPERFASKADAQAQLNVQSVHHEISAEHVEVVLVVRVKSVVQDNEIFRVELAQAGVFTMTGFAPEDRMYHLGSTCPAMLYPFARQTVAGLVKRSGFSELVLRVLDFDSMYAQDLRAQSATANGNA
jgi:preprotein translocase subunit SecB